MPPARSFHGQLRGQAGGPGGRGGCARPPAREGGRGSGLGTDGLNRIQGSRERCPPHSPPHFLGSCPPTCISPPLLLPADGPGTPRLPPTQRPSGELQFRPKPASSATSPLSSEPIGALAPPLAASPTHPRAPNG